MHSEALRSLPYLVHTNRELGLMLAGSKPLALMGYLEGDELDVIIRYLRMFDRHAVAGRFVRHEQVRATQIPGRSQHRILYALPGEEWRINAMLELLDRPGCWSPGKEREFGTLLGYEDWQNDVWAARLPGVI